MYFAITNRTQLAERENVGDLDQTASVWKQIAQICSSPVAGPHHLDAVRFLAGGAWRFQEMFQHTHTQ